MKKLYAAFSILVIVSLLSLYNGCKDSGTEPGPSGGQTVTTSITGTVFDDAGSPLAGVEVKTAGQTKTTNSTGVFTFSNIQVPKDRFVINATKNGYFRGSYADAPKANGTSSVEIYLTGAEVTEDVSASSGGVVQTANGTGVELSSNSVTKSDGSAVTGNVKVSVSYLDPTADNFSELVPGGDMAAQRTDNSQTTLYSYGIIKVDMKNDAGENLKIKSGSTSKITVDIPPEMEGTAPATIPLWYYDDATGLWKEEGVATKQGDKYVGNVAHFSDWNCDVPQGTATVKGLVVDCNNAPVPGITVRIGQAQSSTGSDGRFERRVPANTSFDVQVLGNRNFGLTSTAVSVPPLAEGTTHDVGTLHVECPAYVKGLIKCGTDIKSGQVVISWSGGYNSQFTDGNGAFNLATDIGKEAQLSIYTLDGKYKNMNITTPSVRGQTLDLSEIQVCDAAQVGENKFTLTGGQFNNRTFTFLADTNQVFGYYVPDDTTTFVWMNNIFGQDTIMFWMTFKGDQIGNGTDVFFYLYHNSSYYYATADFPGTSTNVLVTKYSGVGGLIEGSFSGSLINLFGTGVTMNVTDGKFSVIRILGSGQAKKIINKIPPEIRKKLKL